jgi:hypothetical protein
MFKLNIKESIYKMRFNRLTEVKFVIPIVYENLIVTSHVIYSENGFPRQTSGPVSARLSILYGTFDKLIAAFFPAWKTFGQPPSAGIKILRQVNQRKLVVTKEGFSLTTGQNILPKLYSVSNSETQPADLIGIYRGLWFICSPQFRNMCLLKSGFKKYSLSSFYGENQVENIRNAKCILRTNGYRAYEKQLSERPKVWTINPPKFYAQRHEQLGIDYCHSYIYLILQMFNFDVNNLPPPIGFNRWDVPSYWLKNKVNMEQKSVDNFKQKSVDNSLTEK